MNKAKVLSTKSVPVEFGNFAAGRIEPLLRVWARRGDLTLLELSASCYLQGLEDALQLIERRAPEAAELFQKTIDAAKRQGKIEDEN